MMMLLIVLLLLPFVSFGYEDGYYDSREEHNHCGQLKYSDRLLGYVASRRPKFTELERNGKHFIKISCPWDNTNYGLVAEKTGSVLHYKLPNMDFSDLELLLEGVGTDFLAHCDGKRIMAKTPKGDTIPIERVICLTYGTYWA